MPIEIRELVIKTTVEKKPARPQQAAAVDKQELKRELLASCKKMVKKIMKEHRER